jgi:predicted Zn-dependent protease
MRVSCQNAKGIITRPRGDAEKSQPAAKKREFGARNFSRESSAPPRGAWLRVPPRRGNRPEPGDTLANDTHRHIGWPNLSNHAFPMNIRPGFAAAVLTALLLAGCYEVPVTGRHAMNLVDDKEVTKMSIAMFDDMKHQYKVSHDKELNARLKRVGERLQRAVPIWDMPDADWEFVVFDVNQINAFAMAGGKVGVFTGLFKIVKNDDQLASVIAHEIAHVTAKHIHEKLSQELAVNTVGTVGILGAGLGGAGLLTTTALQSAYGITSDIGGAAFDRKKEKEADYIGLMYMARAGFDPQEAVKVLEQLDAEMGTSGAENSLLSTHPSNPERIIQLIDAMPKALAEQAKSNAVAPMKVVK